MEPKATYFVVAKTDSPYRVKPIHVHGSGFEDDHEGRTQPPGMEVFFFPPGMDPPDMQRVGVKVNEKSVVIARLATFDVVGQKKSLDHEIELAVGTPHVLIEAIPAGTTVFRYMPDGDRKLIFFDKEDSLEVLGAAPGTMDLEIEPPHLDGHGLTRIKVTFV